MQGIRTSVGLGLSLSFPMVPPVSTLPLLDLLFAVLVSMSGRLSSAGSSDSLTDSPRL